MSAVHRLLCASLAPLSLLLSCQNTPPEAATPAPSAQTDSTRNRITAEKPRVVYAQAQTQQVKARPEEDAADDAAIWYHRSQPQNSLILGTNKRLGLEVYDLAGRRKSLLPVGRLNNVDVRYGFPWQGDTVDIAAATNRTTNQIDIWTIHPTTGALSYVTDTSHTVALEEVYGFCLYHHADSGRYYAFANSKNGKVIQFLLEPRGQRIYPRPVREFDLGGQLEGMVVDEAFDHLFVGEEEKGIHRLSALPTGGKKATFLAQSSTEHNPNIAYDIEGLTLYPQGPEKGLLLASSQGNNRFVAFDRQPPHTYRGSFRVGDSLTDGAQETDGIAVSPRSFGAEYPRGLFVCQDGKRPQADQRQNFKYISWQHIASTMDW